jgi:hypothetical protein
LQGISLFELIAEVSFLDNAETLLSQAQELLARSSNRVEALSGM